jgi:hypothetical protein
MKRQRILIAALALVGAGVIGYGLSAPLVTVPVVGAVRFTDNILGGVPTARCLTGALVVASVCMGVGGLLARIGVLVGTLALGFLGGLLLSVHRHAMDQVMQIADMGDGKMDEGIAKLLAQMQYGPGAYCAVFGGVMILIAAVVCLWPDRARAGR